MAARTASRSTKKSSKKKTTRKGTTKKKTAKKTRSKSTNGARTKKAAKKKTSKKRNGVSKKAIAIPSIARAASDMESLFPLRTYIDKNGSAKNAPKLSKDLLRRIMRYMVLNRELDERLTKLQRQGRIGFHIGSVGEEALMIGTAAALRPSDWVIPCYREMGVALYRGMSLDLVVANMFGTNDDPVKGRQMPCHYVDREHNFLSISSPVGTQIAQAAGVGWAMRLRGTDDASLVYFGDGATSEGDFHCGMNFAGVFDAATVFVCRNNEWAISTPLSGQTASKTIAQKAIAYGMKGERVDGNDPLAVYAATTEALDRARTGGGPTLLEMCTYRVGAHSTSDDPRSYRSQDEVDPWLEKDPIDRFGAYLKRKKLWSDDEAVKIGEEIEAELQAAIKRAEATPKPPISSLFHDVFAEQTPMLAEQQAELEASLAAGYIPKAH